MIEYTTPAAVTIAPLLNVELAEEVVEVAIELLLV
jgi:hypothetical protein